MFVTCPLSGSQNVSLLASLKTVDLAKLYRRKFKIGVSTEFGNITEINLYHCLDSDLRFFYPMVTGSHTFYETLQI
jgi:hypothetical protein